MSNPFSYKLIETLKNRKTISNGLTIPYLIGSYRLVNIKLTDGAESVLELLTELANSETTMKPVLQHCGDIGKYVIGLQSKSFCLKYFSNELAFKNQTGEKTLYVTSNAASFLGRNIDEIAKALYEKYKDSIVQRNYSWRGYKQVWEPFDTNEIEVIKSIEKLTTTYKH